MTTMTRSALALMPVLLLAGCALTGPSPSTGDGAGAAVPDPGAATPPEEAEPLRAAPAVVELQRQAQVASADGEHDRAAALLERALRMEPQNAALWHNLAIVRYRQGDYPQTESMALRSNGFVHGRRDLERRNWELIAAARELLGDLNGAGDARRRAETLAAGGG